MAKRQQVVRDTRQRILDAALEVFGERGIAGASVDDVASAAGLTKGAVYYYFDDKDDLARDLQHQLWAQLAERALAAYDADLTITENLLACFEAFLDAVRAMPVARVFLREAWFVPELDTAGRAEQEDALGPIRDLLVDGMARGELVELDPDATTRVLVGALMEGTLHVLGSGDADATLAVVRRIVAAFEVSEVTRGLDGLDAPRRTKAGATKGAGARGRS
jgi:AcrR family transcriptional regulator